MTIRRRGLLFWFVDDKVEPPFDASIFEVYDYDRITVERIAEQYDPTALACYNCAHYQSNSWDDCRKSQRQGYRSYQLRRLTTHEAGFETCGIDAKWFERATPETFDFVNNPPPAYAWA